MTVGCARPEFAWVQDEIGLRPYENGRPAGEFQSASVLVGEGALAQRGAGTLADLAAIANQTVRAELLR